MLCAKQCAHRRVAAITAERIHEELQKLVRVVLAAFEKIEAVCDGGAESARRHAASTTATASDAAVMVHEVQQV